MDFPEHLFMLWIISVSGETTDCLSDRKKSCKIVRLVGKCLSSKMFLGKMSGNRIDGLKIQYIKVAD